MNWTQFSIALGIIATLAGAVWKAASAWTTKAIALGEKAEAERAKERELMELRRSHEKFMERVGGIDKDMGVLAGKLEVLSARVEEREKERVRRDTLGIPVRGNGE